MQMYIKIANAKRCVASGKKSHSDSKTLLQGQIMVGAIIHEMILLKCAPLE